MKELRRYLDDERADALARALVRSAAHDGLDEVQMATLARALGADEGRAALAARQGASSARSVSTPTALTAAKWGGLLAVVAMVVTGGWLLVRHDGDARPASAPLATVSPDPLLATPSAPERSETSAPEAVPIPVTVLPEAPPAPTSMQASRDAKRNAGGHRASPSPATEDLSAEVRALERVRIALAEQRVADARAGLASYERTFRNKLLRNEARVLDITTLLAEGHRDEAEARARAFLAVSPDSPYANRVRSLIASAQHR